MQLVAADGSLATLLDWEKLIATDTWVTRTASLTDYGGQTVFLYFGQSSGEARYVDNITVLTDGSPRWLCQVRMAARPSIAGPGELGGYGGPGFSPGPGSGPGP